MNELKQQLIQFSKDPETYKSISQIGDKYDLMIDIQDELGAEVKDVIRGYKPSKDFISNIQKRLEIDNATANSIALDVNKEIFEKIRDKLQKIQAEEINTPIQSIEKPQTPPPTVESVGKFTIEKPPVGMGTPVAVKKEEVLKEIEDPEQLLEAPSIDHILTTPVVSVEKVEVKKVDVAPVEKKPYTLDPYREQI